MAQPVFTTATAIHYELWVESNFDSDRDGKNDRIHVDVSRPAETDAGLKVPVIFEDSPYYAGGADITNFDVDHELGQPPAARIKAPYFQAGNTSPQISTAHESYWLPRGFAVVHSESPGTGHSDGCTDLRRAQRDARRRRRHRLAQRPRARATRPGPAPSRRPRPPGTTARPR